MVKNLFSTLFKPAKKSQSKSAHKRPIILNTEQDALAFLDTHLDVNTDKHKITQALEKVSNLEALKRLAQHKEPSLRTQARKRIIDFLKLPNTLTDVNDLQTLCLIVNYSDDEDLASNAMANIKDEHTYFQLAQTGEAKVRLLAAKYINQEQQLLSLQKQFLNKDKALHNYCKKALQTIKQKAEQQEQEQQSIVALLEQLQIWIKIGFEPDLKAKLKIAQNKWQDFQLASNEQQIQYTTSVQELKQIVQQAENAQQALIAEQAEKHEQQQQQKELIATANTLWEELKTQFHPEASTRYEQLKQVANPTKPLTLLLNNIEQAIHAYNSLDNNKQAITSILEANIKTEVNSLALELKKIQKIQASIAFPKDVHTPQALLDLDKKSQWIKHQQIEINTQQPSLCEQYKTHLQTLDNHIQEGEFKQANKALKQVQKIENKLTEKSLAKFKAQAQTLKSQLHEMQNWQHFAVTPKKQDLCDKMQALCESQLPPTELAKEIKQLQIQWKELGQADNEKALWERFHELSEQAFKPCKQHYENEAKQRANNLLKRQALIQQLIDYEKNMDWSKADWSAVQKTLQEAQKAFKHFSPVENAAHKTSWAEFKQAQDSIYAYLQTEYDKNLEKKQALIDAASLLAQQEDSQQAANQAKELQEKWKTIGICPHGANQALWKQFREQCDIIFDKLKNTIKANKQANNEEFSRLESLLNNAQELCLAPISQEKKSQLTQIMQNINEAELPSALNTRLLKHYKKLEEQQRQAQKAYQQQQQLRAWQNLAIIINALDTNQEAKEELSLPKGYHYQELIQLNQSAQENNEQALTLCIALEILNNIDSPKEDEEKRMQYQVARLAKGMGKNENTEKEKQEIIQQWVSIKKSSALASRFNALLIQESI